MPRSREPFVWLLFSAGGMTAAILLPAVVFVLWIAGPLGWISVASYPELAALFRHPLARFILFAVISVSLFHWAHRFRYTLYDGLQLYHLNHLIAVVTYGLATVLTLVAAYGLWVVG
ncbi:MAG: fumarate reductase subunit D [Gemmatimonadetes bacterium]|nr:fumarate reductase subunit D [Gemmatimonadota bacterium]